MNHPARMIVTDLDGTLLQSDKRISDYTAEILGRCREKGHKLVFATARPLRAVRLYADSIPLDAMIIHGGSIVYANDTELFRYGIPAEMARNILLSLRRDYPGARLCAEINDTLYANYTVPIEWNHTEAVFTDFTDLPERMVEKILIHVSSMEEMADLVRYLPGDLYIEITERTLALVMNREATKLKGVQALCRHFGIALEQVVAFGDDYNDMGMLKGCGLGVAMGNALDEVKAVADETCGTNDEDGVARWLAGRLL